MKFLIIHLARAVQRAENVALLQSRLPGAVEVVDAVDARQLTEQNMAEIAAQSRPFPPYPFALKPAEIACFLSHRKAWDLIAQGPDTGAMIIEDDVLIDEARFGPALDLVRANASAEDYVRFSPKQRETPRREIAAAGGARLFEPVLGGLGTQAQFVGRAAAAKLLHATRHFDRPVDVALQMSWVTGVKLHCVAPSGVSEISGEIGGSLIGGGRASIGAKLHRELARPLYRAALSATARVKGRAE